MPLATRACRVGIVVFLAAVALGAPAAALAQAAPAPAFQGNSAAVPAGGLSASAWQTGTTGTGQRPLAWDFSWMPQWAIYDATVNVSNVLWLVDAVLLGTCRFLVTFRSGLANSTGYLVAALFKQLAPFYLVLGSIAALGWAALIFARYFTRFRISTVDRLVLVVVLAFVLVGSGPGLLQAFEGLRGFIANLTYTLAVRSFGGQPTPLAWCNLSARENDPQVCSGYEVALGYVGITDEATLAVALPPGLNQQFFEYNGVPVSSSWFADQDKEARDHVLTQVKQAPIYLLEEGGLALRAVIEELVWTLLAMATVALLAALAFALLFAAFIPAGDLVGNIFRLSLELFMLSGWTGLLMGMVAGVTRPWLNSPADHVLDLLGTGIFASVLYAWVGVAVGQLIMRAFRTITASVTVETAAHWTEMPGGEAGPEALTTPSYARLPGAQAVAGLETYQPKFMGVAGRPWTYGPDLAPEPDMPALPGQALVAGGYLQGGVAGPAAWHALDGGRSTFFQPAAPAVPPKVRDEHPVAGAPRPAAPKPAPAAPAEPKRPAGTRVISLPAEPSTPAEDAGASDWLADVETDQAFELPRWQVAARAAYAASAVQPAEAWLNQQPGALGHADQINWLVASAQTLPLSADEFVAVLEQVAGRAEAVARQMLMMSPAGEVRLSAAQAELWLRQAAQVLSVES